MGEDKLLHFLVGCVLGFVFRSILGLFFGMLIIVGYELCQLVFKTGTPEVMDALAGIFGLVIVWFFVNWKQL